MMSLSALVYKGVNNLCSGGGLVATTYLTLATPWTVACQAPLSRAFSKQEYWSVLSFPSPGIEPGSLAF